MDNLIIICDLVVVVLAIMCGWLSIRLMITTSRGQIKIGWWTLLPFVILFAITNRLLVLSCYIGWLPDWLSDYVPSLMVIFWIGFTVFLWGINKVTEEIVK